MFAMRLSIFFLLLVGALQSCSQKPNRAQPKYKDTSINKFVLLNSRSIQETLGDQTGKIIEDEKATRIIVSNSDSSEFLTLFHLDGSNVNTFNEFEVSKKREMGMPIQIVKDKFFVTESGVRLGMTLEQLLQTKGKGVIKKDTMGVTIISYKIKNTELQNKYEMPIYESSYYFKKNKLFRFTFGFPNL
jgi:hypothetical protein